MGTTIYNPEGFEVKFHQPCLNYELNRQKIELEWIEWRETNSEEKIIKQVLSRENHYLDANILGEICNKSYWESYVPCEWKSIDVAFIATLYADNIGQCIVKVIAYSGGGLWRVYNIPIKKIIEDEHKRRRTLIAVADKYYSMSRKKE